MGVGALMLVLCLLQMLHVFWCTDRPWFGVGERACGEDGRMVEYGTVHTRCTVGWEGG